MRDRLIITISDIHGSKQYTVHEMIKQAIWWAVVGVALIIFATYIYISIINKQLNDLDEKMVTVQTKSLELEKLNTALFAKNKTLEQGIKERSEKLASIDSKLKEVEETIGIGPDINASIIERLEGTKTIQVEKIAEVEKATEEKLAEVEKNKEQMIEEAKVTAIQSAFLSKSIPSGKFLEYRRISSKFGYRIHPVTNMQSFHAGIDLSAPSGTPIYAPADGTVEYSEPKGAYGNFLLISHSYGFKTAYGHLSKYAVSRGDFVSKGDVIAYVGSTGRSTGPHLHYEIRYLNQWLDPKNFMMWNTENVDGMKTKVSKVNWNQILKQIQKTIDLVR